MLVQQVRKYATTRPWGGKLYFRSPFSLLSLSTTIDYSGLPVFLLDLLFYHRTIVYYIVKLLNYN